MPNDILTMLAIQKRMKYILAAQLVVVTNPSIMTYQLLTTICSYNVTAQNEYPIISRYTFITQLYTTCSYIPKLE